ncbi:MAG: helix-hairpin-helix domain-containing protein [Actinomycetota bacterium]
MQEIVVSTSVKDRLEALAGRRRDIWAAAGVVVALVIAGLAWWSRGAPAAIAPPAVSPSTPALSQTGVIFVHIAGAVRSPGLYELPSGARVADAIESAGGPLRRGDLDALNLAQVLADGMKVTVSRIGQAAPPDAGSGEEPASDAVSLNSADQAALEEVPGIGPVTAAAILEHRTRIGTFQSLDQLLDVTGIGPATLESLRPYLTL